MRMPAIAALLALAACATAPQERFYTLSGPAAASAPAGAPASTLTISVGPVTVPEEVDRTPMVLRTGPNRVQIDEQHRWAEPVKSGIARVLADSLSRALGTPRVYASRQGAGATPDVRVAVEVRRFDSSLADGATIDAVWSVSGAKVAPKTGRSVITEPATSPDPEGVAAAHGRALARLGAEIAAAIR